jgi:hypothetical protein
VEKVGTNAQAPGYAYVSLYNHAHIKIAANPSIDNEFKIILF